MLTGIVKSRWNEVIDAASDTIKTVVLAIAADPGDPIFRADWLQRYPAIKDLNVISTDDVGDIEITPEFSDRYPAAFFYIDEVQRGEPNAEQLAIASLALRIECQGENFALAQREMFEVYNAIRSVFMSDRSLGHITGRGGVVEWIRWSSFAEPTFIITEMRKSVVGGSFFFEVALRDVLI
jgi:hypothetical protein